MGSQTNCLLQCQHTELAASKSVNTSYPQPQSEDHNMGACRLEAHLLALEREHKKIDAFKRELPLCMQLLHDAMEACKEKLAFFHSSSQRQLQGLASGSFNNRDSVVQNELGEQEPLTLRKQCGPFYVHSNEEGEQARVMPAIGDAFHWTRIWNTRAELSSGNQEENRCTIALEEGSPWYMQEQAFCWPTKPFLDSNKRLGGAFLPYNRLIQPTPRPGAIDPAVLSLKCPDSEITGPPNQLDLSKIHAKSWESAQGHDHSSTTVGLSLSTKRETNSEQQVREAVSKEKKDSIISIGSHSTRKARRSWSPELHRLFVDALQKLGGAQATPKQIRELMNVEGLTNDEVKSHLQKYRLHARRLGMSPTSSSQSIGVVSTDRACVSTESALHAQGAATISYNTNILSQSQSCEASVRQDANCCSSRRAHSQLSSCNVKQFSEPHSRHCVKQLTLPHSRHSWQGTDVGGEESVGEAAKPENSGSKGRQMYETDEMEDHSFSGSQTHSLSEDDMGCDDKKMVHTFGEEGLQ